MIDIIIDIFKTTVIKGSESIISAFEKKKRNIKIVLLTPVQIILWVIWRDEPPKDINNDGLKKSGVMLIVLHQSLIFRYKKTAIIQTQCLIFPQPAQRALSKKIVNKGEIEHITLLIKLWWRGITQSYARHTSTTSIPVSRETTAM